MTQFLTALVLPTFNWSCYQSLCIIQLCCTKDLSVRVPVLIMLDLYLSHMLAF